MFSGDTFLATLGKGDTPVWSRLQHQTLTPIQRLQTPPTEAALLLAGPGRSSRLQPVKSIAQDLARERLSG
jgi:hypothetical protein